jgi:phage terminase small subunit
MSTSPPRAPAGLGPQGRKLWADVLGSYLLTPGETTVLTALCHATDQLAKLNAELSKAELWVIGSRKQPVPNPLLAEVRAHAKTIENLQRALCLPAPGAKSGQWRNPNMKAAIDTRWRRQATIKARDARVIEGA